MKVESDVANWAQTFDKCDPGKPKYRQELSPNAEYQQCRVFVRNDLVERKIESCRKSSKRFLELKKKLGLDPNLVACDEQDIISTLQVAFEGEIILSQQCIENKRIDAYLIIESHGITIIRTNSDAADFEMNRLINQIYNYIAESIKKQTKRQTKK